MPASHERFEYHLTPSGWVEGSEYLDVGSHERPTPPDRVLTVERIEIMPSTFSRIEVSYEETYRSSDSTAVEALIAKYGNRP